jgi:hypothetical protein
MPAKPKGSIVIPDDAMREKWWQLHLAGYSHRVICQRFRVPTNVISLYLKGRREQEGVSLPERADTVTLTSKLKGTFLPDTGLGVKRTKHSK